MEIKVLGPVHAEEYWLLRLRALKEDPDGFATSYEENVNKPNPIEMTEGRLQPSNDGFTIGAFNDEGKLVGVATLMREKHKKLFHKAWVLAVYVASEERGKGLAKKILQAMKKRAEQIDGLEQLMLAVITNNPAAVNLYKSVGFETFGTERNSMKLDDQYWDEYHMVLFLNKKS